jgi:hypothetical protein
MKTVPFDSNVFRISIDKDRNCVTLRVPVNPLLSISSIADSVDSKPPSLHRGQPKVIENDHRID